MRRQQWSCSPIIVCSLVLLCFNAVSTSGQKTSGTADGSEEWGYVEVRKGAHMFWWLYKSPAQTATDWPIILWLQGGPGASGVGIGNFGEMGPLTIALRPRQYTWLQKAHLLFVDSPVGAGFSYVTDKPLLCTSDEDVAMDLVTLLQAFFKAHPQLQSSPLFVFAESYGGKHATLLGLALNKAIKVGYIKAKFGGIALGDSWISPVDSVLSWGPVLKSFSRIDDHQKDIIAGKAKSIQAEVEKGAYLDAKNGWNSLEKLVSNFSNNIDFYNILIDQGQDSSLSSVEAQGKKNNFQKFGSYLKTQMSEGTNQSIPDLTSVMNGPIRKKLQIIPDTVTWKELSKSVFAALAGDFMKDVISKVDELLSSGVKVTIYSGQLDLICASQGTENWVQKLTWAGMAGFQGAARRPLYCNSKGGTSAFVKAYKNLTFFWILLAGHMVPADNPCTALEMVGLVTNT